MLRTGDCRRHRVRSDNSACWGLFAVLLCLAGLATIEPEAAEAVNTSIGIGAFGCVLWAIWQLMQYDQ
jgi:hypothetical protein